MVMPLFRIIGGQQPSSASNNSSSNNNNNNMNNQPSQQQSQSTTPNNTRSASRYTYPGQRATIHINNNPITSAHQHPASTQIYPTPLPPPLTSSSSSSFSLLPTETPRGVVGAMQMNHPLYHSTHPLPDPPALVHRSVSGSASSSASGSTNDFNDSSFSSSMASTNTSTTNTNTTTNTTTTTPAPTPTTTPNTVIRGSNVPPGASHRVPPPSTPVTNSDSSRPGAYQVTRTSSGPSQVYRVTVPQGVRPGSEFTVHAGPRRVRVRCPPNSRPGQSLQITLPPEPETHHLQLRMAPLTSATGTSGGGAVVMTPEVRRVNEQAAASGGTAQSFLVSIPNNVYPGMQFTVNVSGQRFMVTCPPSAGPGMRVRIVPPTVPEEPEAAPKTQVFEVAVPYGVVPGQPFALVANGQRVLVTCPPKVEPGQKIRFQLPVSEVVGNIQLSYESEKGGWSRTIRVSDLKFQWVRLDGNNDSKNNSSKDNISKSGGGPETKSSTGDLECSSFDFHRSAYVRKLIYLEGNDARMRTGRVELVPASEAVVDSRLVVHNRTLLSYSDIAQVQDKSLDDKTEWFQNVCNKLAPAWEDGHIKIVVRRKHLLSDSVKAIMSLGCDDMRKRWQIEFLGESGIDAGGLTREWFELVTDAVYDPAFGLWTPSVNNQVCVNIHPASGISCPDNHLVYFRFLGRVLGRALFDRQAVKGLMVRTLYKHLLGWPVTFEDIQTQDEDLYKSPWKQKLAEMDLEHVAGMRLDVNVTEKSLAVKGQSREKQVEQSKPQLTELLLGFFDIIPEPALTVFDPNELELILCGLPHI